MGLLYLLILGEKDWGWPGLHTPHICSDPHPLYYQVAALCFVLVLGSLVPCLPEFSSSSQTVKEDPMATDSVYTASQSECLLSQATFPQSQLRGKSQIKERRPASRLATSHSTSSFCKWRNRP